MVDNLRVAMSILILIKSTSRASNKLKYDCKTTFLNSGIQLMFAQLLRIHCPPDHSNHHTYKYKTIYLITEINPYQKKEKV